MDSDDGFLREFAFQIAVLAILCVGLVTIPVFMFVSLAEMRGYDPTTQQRVLQIIGGMISAISIIGVALASSHEDEKS